MSISREQIHSSLKAEPFSFWLSFSGILRGNFNQHLYSRVRKFGGKETKWSSGVGPDVESNKRQCKHPDPGCFRAPVLVTRPHHTPFLKWWIELGVGGKSRSTSKPDCQRIHWFILSKECLQDRSSLLSIQHHLILSWARNCQTLEAGLSVVSWWPLRESILLRKSQTYLYTVTEIWEVNSGDGTWRTEYD